MGFDLGAYARTYSDAGLTGIMSVTGGGTVKRRNVQQETFSLACSNTGTQCFKNFKSFHTCDVSRNEIAASTGHSAVFANSHWQGNISQSKVCLAPPNAEVSLSYEGQTGSALLISLPVGASAPVTLSGAHSVSADGSSMSYSWLAGGVSIGTGISNSVTVSSNTTVTLNVQEGDGTTDSAIGTVAINHPSCPGITPITGGCEDQNGNPIWSSGAGSVEAPDEWFGGGLGTKTVCDTIWWYEWTGAYWELVEVEVLWCWQESV